LKRVQTTSTYGGENEISTFLYNEKCELQQIVYQHDDKQYFFDFNYANGLPTSVNIGGKKKIEFIYSNDTLKSIIREQSGAFAEYDFTYPKGQPKAEIKLFVVNKGKRQASTYQYFVAWNKEYKLTDFSLDVYTTKAITYANNGGIASFGVRDYDGNEKVMNWEYSAEENNNWTERKLDKFSARRIIEYAAR
jgi:hypothetical protein